MKMVQYIKDTQYAHSNVILHCVTKCIHIVLQNAIELIQIICYKSRSWQPQSIFTLIQSGKTAIKMK